MDDTSVVAGGDPDRRELLEMLAQYGAPAYVRRARGVEEALERLLEQARARREDWLAMSRLRVGELRCLAGEWSALAPYLPGKEDQDVLVWLHAELAPVLRVPVARTTWRRALRRQLRDLNESLERFNRRWRQHLDELDLTVVNELREGYNRYYLLEKECALRSPALARRGYQPLTPLTLAEVEARLPLLPVPRLL